MYSLVLRQLNPMQKGIQSAHSIVEYASKYHKRTEFIQWSNVDKTIIVLDGGTYQDLKECRNILDELEVKYSCFYEEDLNGLLTSISFIVEDKVWDTKSYPSPEEPVQFPFIGSQVENPLWGSDSDNNWIDAMGGPRNLKFRNFLFSKKLSC